MSVLSLPPFLTVPRLHLSLSLSLSRNAHTTANSPAARQKLGAAAEGDLQSLLTLTVLLQARLLRGLHLLEQSAKTIMDELQGTSRMSVKTIIYEGQDHHL